MLKNFRMQQMLRLTRDAYVKATYVSCLPTHAFSAIIIMTRGAWLTVPARGFQQRWAFLTFLKRKSDECVPGFLPLLSRPPSFSLKLCDEHVRIFVKTVSDVPELEL